ncbi:MAG TPA: nucleoside triphosphate pyrophosphatase [Jiangellales bacterium]|nr:nucleoside triphosphate pyrophosphatase [Jiangellales bacterium]
MTRLVLASASPARLATLRRAGLAPEVVVSRVDESCVDEGSPERTASALARLKARTVAAGLDSPAVVVGCDSVLDLDGETHGKPGSAAEAASRWRRMRGRDGVLHTGHHVVDTRTGREASAFASTRVHFADVSDAEIEAYVATGEPLVVAGGFTLDGLGGAFVEGVEGDHHNVVGISLPLLRRLLGELGVAWTDLWAPRPEAGPE